MVNINLLGRLNQFFLVTKNNFKKIYKNSNFYDKKISKVNDNYLKYKPSPHLLSSIIKYQKKKHKIEDFDLDTMWQSKINLEDYKKLNNFFWFFSLDLKSSKKKTQSIITNWISKNNRFDKQSW